MTITTTWSIDDLEYDPTDGFVKNAYWRLEGKNGDKLIYDRGGSAWFAKPESLPDDFVPYSNLKEATVINWVKAQIGTELCEQWERDVSYETVKGKPF